MITVSGAPDLVSWVVFCLLKRGRVSDFESSRSDWALFSCQDLHQLFHFVLIVTRVVDFGWTCDHLFHLGRHLDLFAARQQDDSGAANQLWDVW